MKIAYIADPYSIHNAKWINLIAEKENVFLYTYPHKKEDSPISENVNTIEILPKTYPLLNIIKREKVLQNIRQHIKTNNIQILHSMYAIPFSFWGDELKIVPHIITTRGSDVLVEYAQDFQNPKTLREHYIYPAFRKKVKKAFNNARFITSTSQKQQTVIKQFVNDSTKLKLIRTGVNTSLFNNDIDRKKSHIIYSARGLKSIYNIDIIIDAFKLLLEQEETKKYQLVLASYPYDEEYYNFIKEKINQLNIGEKIKILPKLSNKEMIQQYYKSDMVVMVPSSDGTPVSGIEAMLSKTPLIMGNIDYDSDLFNKDTTWKTDSISAESIKKSMVEIISSKTKTISSKLKLANEVALKNANLESSIADIYKLYKQVLRETAE